MQWINIFSSVSKKMQLCLIIIIIMTTIFFLSVLSFKHIVTTDNLKRLKETSLFFLCFIQVIFLSLSGHFHCIHQSVQFKQEKVLDVSRN